MERAATIQSTIRAELLRHGPCALQALLDRLPQFSWSEVFAAIDRLSREGSLVLRHPSQFDFVWVLIEGVQKPRTKWTYRTYTLSEDELASVRDANLHARPISTVRRCRSYTELCASLYAYGLTPPPPDYFMPTSEEQTEGVESIVRGVMRPRLTCQPD